MPLLDQYGRPVKRADLTRDVAGPSLSGVRSQISGYPGDGLTPVRLANILREADAGDPLRYLELAETIEERDPHYLGVLGTRRRSVSQLEITVKDASDDPIDKQAAQFVRDWLDRGELTDELFHILDAIGKGYSLTEIIWDHSEGQWWPDRLELRDPRWFGFHHSDLNTPLMYGDDGQLEPLAPYKFIVARMAAKSGIMTRSGLARIVMWPYLFKKFTERDWTIFCQTYGQPLRLGKFGPDATEEDRATLMRAVSNIAGDCAGIIPESMMIEFIQSKNISGSIDLYERRSDWLDKQVSKAVLGQTATTDAEVGGLGSGKEHRAVQEDIERADATALAAILTRDLVMPMVNLNFGERRKYPKIVIARPEAEDLAAWTSAVTPWVDRGMLVDEGDVREKFGLRAPAAGARILGNSPQTAPQTEDQPGQSSAMPAESAVKYPLNTRLDPQRDSVALSAEGPSEGRTAPLTSAADRLASEAAPEIEAMLVQIETMLARASDLDEAREMLLAAYPNLPTDGLTRVLAGAFAATALGGRAAVMDEADG